MTESPRIDGLLQRIRGEVRRRRAEYYGVRGAFWGAVGGVAGLLSKHGVGRAAPRIARALGVAVAPPIPLPSGRLPDFLPSGEEEREERASSSMLEETSRPLAKDQTKRSSFEERDFAQRAGGSGASTTGDLSAIFKDTSLASQRPDFNSFMKKGDERLRMLEQVDRLPDLQSDFTNSQDRRVYRKSKALTAGR